MFIRTRWDMTVLSAVDHYGNEFNVETKRKLMQRCEKAPRFLREMLEGFRDARQTIIWTKPSGAKQGRVCVSDGSFCRYYETDSAGSGKKYFYG